jgi:hypothetical protein
MSVIIEPYRAEYRGQIRQLVWDDDHERDRTKWFVDRYPQCTHLALMDTEVVGVSAYSGAMNVQIC